MLMLSTFGGIGVRLFSNHGRMKVEQYGNFAEEFNMVLFYVSQSHTGGARREVSGAVEATEAMLLRHDAHHEVLAVPGGDLGESLRLAFFVAVFGAVVRGGHPAAAVAEERAVLVRVVDAVICWNIAIKYQLLRRTISKIILNIQPAGTYYMLYTN